MPTRPLSSRSPVDRQRVLHESVGAPRRLRVVADLHDGVGALALLLRERHDGRVVTRARRLRTPVLTPQRSLSW